MPDVRPVLPTPGAEAPSDGARPPRRGPDHPTRAAADPARAAVRGGVLGNYVDQFDIFLPVLALAPVAAELYGTRAVVTYAGLVFVATLVGRPLGAAVLGSLADRVGRAVVARASMLGLAVTTLLIAALPVAAMTHEAVLLAVVVLRFVSGVLIGGGYTSAVPLAIEWTAPRRRGLVSGVVMAMSPAANATIAALVLVLLGTLGPDGYAAWGWRVPFVVGAALAFVAVGHFRRHVRDTPERAAAAPAGRPLTTVLVGAERHRLWRLMVLMTGLWLFTNLAVAVVTSQLGVVAGLDGAAVTRTMLVATAVSAAAMVASGHASTRAGRRRYLTAFGAAAAVLAPASYLAGFAGPASPAALVALVTVLQVVTVSAYGPIGAYLAERFPPAVRSSGYGTAYSLSIVLPALYPFWLPPLQRAFGDVAPVAALLAVAGVLVAVGAATSPGEAMTEGPAAPATPAGA
ncbi:MFS transporter [Cellulomonas shaoxiangyii]|uniref:MFS transporter n=1 Tax=Cellulomonas shaoxiangyii TaxID=2566013 RepID=A0A4P7SFS6_9CELL|nr:MFS transporter [Cellulomonas shaoxiangyii]QCB92411.1 MFS transporter [Cellulomonas shaoxiangyii]TGY85614.1 MFS transporter [Cellulomonas shaoxiangyii]